MDEGRLLVVCKDDGTLEVIDLATAQRVGRIGASGIAPHEVAATRDGRAAYLPVYSDAPVGAPGSDGRAVDVIDLSTFRRTRVLRLPIPSRPHQPAVLGTDRVLVSTELDRSA